MSVANYIALAKKQMVRIQYTEHNMSCTSRYYPADSFISYELGKNDIIRYDRKTHHTT